MSVLDTLSMRSTEIENVSIEADQKLSTIICNKGEIS